CDELEPDWVWQCSHVGGDRFAGNLVCLPEGLFYGRVDRSIAGALVDEHLAGRILLDLFRGRSAHPVPVQAADRHVREREQLTAIGDVELESVSGRDGSWQVELRAAGRTHTIR